MLVALTNKHHPPPFSDGWPCQATHFFLGYGAAGSATVKIHHKYFKSLCNLFVELAQKQVVIIEEACYPDAAYSAFYAGQRLQQGKYDPVEPVLPLYMRPTPAEIALAKKQKAQEDRS